MTTATRGMGREGAVYLIATVVQRGLPVLVLPILTRLLDASAVGGVALGLAISNIASILFGLGAQYAVVRLVHDDEAIHGRTWAAVVWRQLAVSALLIVATAATAPLWLPSGDSGDAERGNMILVSLALGWVIAAQGIMLSLARTSRRVRLFLGMTVVQAIAGQAAGIALAPIAGAVGYLLGMLAGTAVSAVLGHVVQRVPLAWRVVDQAGIAKFSAWFLAQWATLWVLNMSDRFFVEAFLGSDVVGVYYVAYVVGTGLTLVLDAAQSAWVPRLFASRDTDMKAQLLERVLLPYTGVCAVLSLAVALSAPLLLRIVSPDAPSWGVAVIVIVSLCATVRPMYLVAVAIMNDHKDSRSAALATAGSAVVNVAINATLIPIVGVVVAAVSSVVAYALQSVLALALGRRYSAVTGRTVARVAIAWLVSAALTAGIAMLPSDPWIDTTRVLVGVVLVGVIGVALLRRLRH